MRKLLLPLLLMAASGAQAQGQQSQVTASNGIVIDVNADDFAGRYEYSAPIIRFGEDNSSFALVARVRQARSPGAVHVQGVISYNGEWRFYEQALYRGGARANYRRVNGNVVSCRGSRYSGCALSETFHLDFTPAEVSSHAQNGVLTVQIRARSGQPLMLNLPLNYIDAVTEVSNRPAGTPSSPQQPSGRQ